MIEKQGVKKSHIVDYLNQNSDQFKIIKEEIINLYDEGVFILKEGDLEDYLKISKDLMNVISFCQNNFETWIEKEKETRTNSKLSELEEIFKKILNL